MFRVFTLKYNKLKYIINDIGDLIRINLKLDSLKKSLSYWIKLNQEGTAIGFNTGNRVSKSQKMSE